MADRKRSPEEAAARAMLAAGRDAAKRALEDLGLSEEEKAVKEAERARAAKLRRWKWIAIIAVVFFVGVSLVFLIAKIWIWILLLAVAAGGAYFGYRALKKRLSDGGDEVKVVPAKPEPKALPEPIVEEPDPAVERAARARKAEDENARIEAELAALKNKVGK